MRLKMTKTARDELLASYRPLYFAAASREKSRILSGFLEATGYSRKHAISILNHKQVGTANRLGRKAKLSHEATSALVEAWLLAGRICSKRLVPFLPEVLNEMEKASLLRLSMIDRMQLLSVSPSTVDRILKPERRKYTRSRSTTKRASLLKSKVPVRTFTEWNDVKPGFFEIDTVSHCSSSAAGAFVSTLNMTDIATCWTEPIAILHKGSTDVIGALEHAQTLLPFPLLGIDFDNGSEFLNADLLAWCDERHITYTRSREYKKNDQAWIEEKNGSVVRRLAGRERYEGQKTWQLLRQLYAEARLYINFFQPSQKLILKHRKGAKTYKKYDRAKTPYQRVLDSPHIGETLKARLREVKETLSMVASKNKLSQLQEELRKQAVDAPNPLVAAAAAQRIATYKFLGEGKGKEAQPPSTKVEKMKQSSAAKEIRKAIQSLPNGTTISASDFKEFGSRTALDSYFHRMAQSGELRRIGWGQYEIHKNGLPASR